MAHEKNRFYVTTPIYYGTAKPHLGSLYSTLIADVTSRWQKLQGKETFFLTGTDEHGQKVAQAAEKAGLSPKEFVDGFIDAYKRLWYHYELSYDYFIRTTDPEHIVGVQEWIRVAQKNGDIYKSEYSGWYCTPCETYLTEVEEKQKDAPPCSSCGRETSYVSEESYFFKLSAYQDKLLAFYKNNPDFIVPKERANEVIRFVESGLKDLSISRTTVKWGVPFPDDPKHVVYVWADALMNYITAIGYGQKAKQKEFDLWWPADMHVLGKDIVRFHAVYWPAFLMAADLPLPKKLLVHGWIKVADQKMSKSLGNVVDPEILYKHYGADPVRYYLMRHMAITHDTSFSVEDLEKRITSDLANDLGNLLNRTLTLAFKNELYQVPKHTVWAEGAVDLRNSCWDAIEDYTRYMNEGMFHLALAKLWEFIHKVNSYFHTNEPWKVAKVDKAKFTEIISATCHSLYTVGTLLWPIMPKKMEQLLANLGQSFSLGGNHVELLSSNRWDHTFTLQITQTLFEKPEMLEKAPAKSVTIEAKTEEKKEDSEFISIDDVIKVDLRVGTIIECEDIPKSDKLYKLQVDLGPLGTRQILAGIRKSFEHDDLVGRQAVFIVNLKPRKMMGFESQGMLLAADKGDKSVAFVSPSDEVPNGTRLK